MTMPGISVELGFTAGPTTAAYMHADDITRGKADTGTAAPDNLFTNVTYALRGFTTRRGSSRVEGPVVRYEAGTATVILHNSNRDFDPEHLTGPYVSGGVTQIQPMLTGRIRATWAGVTYDLYRGFADGFDEDSGRVSPDYSETTLRMTDGFKVLTSNNRPAGAAAGSGEDSGARVNRILDSVGWPAADRQVSAGDTTLQATTGEGTPLVELQAVADTEVGELYVDEGGRVTFRGRLSVLEDTRSATSQGTFGSAAGELKYVAAGRDYDGETIVNRVRISRAGGATQTAEDATSISRYLVSTHEKTDLLMQTDGDALAYAQFIVYQGKHPEKRFSTLTVDPRADPDALFPQVLGRKIGDRITIRRRPPGGGAPIEKDVFIRGISHSYTAPAKWLTVWTLESASKWQFMVADNAALGRADFNAAAY
jgi:hypothetical protein